MKIQTNFSHDLDRSVPTLLGTAWVAVVLALGLAVWIVRSALGLSHALPALKAQAADLAAKPTPAPVASPLTPEALSDLRRRIRKINALDAVEGRSPATFLARLEKLLPSGARLLDFQEDGRAGSLQLVVEAVNLEELSRFLAALEGDPTFSKVALTKQSRTQVGQTNWIQFTVDLTENRP